MKKTVNSSNNVFTTLGATNHSNRSREKQDYYSTDPKAIDYLLEHEQFDNDIWECACGSGNLSKRLVSHGYKVYSTDIVYRNYGEKKRVDFLKCTEKFKGDIITNPPYKQATEFVIKALELSNQKVAMFLRIQFLESKKRYEEIFRKNPPKKILVFVKRIKCYPDDCDTIKNSAICYCWIVWDKKYSGKPLLEWIDNRDDGLKQHKSNRIIRLTEY